ncbi:MAG: NUDIX domain-containing protein [Caldilineaceae bacterium]|nr:NUDIX domain-containing protein [Caldilineaceae bacterium]
MGLTATVIPLLARIWRMAPPRLRGAITWAVTGKVIVGVSGVLLTDAQQVLLLRHRFHQAGIWGMPGGWLSPGETIFACWRREVREELALEIVVEEIIGHRSTSRTLEFFLLGRISGGQLAIDPIEIVEARPFSEDELPPMERFHKKVVEQALGARRECLSEGGNRSLDSRSKAAAGENRDSPNA